MNQATQQRADFLFAQQHLGLCKSADRMMMWLMLLQWFVGILIAATVTPYTWIGSEPRPHIHVWGALTIGSLLSAIPTILALRDPGSRSTRLMMATAQVGWSTLLIHITGGRIETHFHIFGSLAFLAFYRDVKVIILASALVAVDHIVRGVWWPQSVYGVLTENPLLWCEHAGWVIFEDVFLLLGMQRSLTEMRQICIRQAKLESSYESVEGEVRSRTRELEEAKEFFQVVLDSVDANICILDQEGRIIETNQNWKRFAEENDSSGVDAGLSYLDACRNATGECRPGALALADAIEEMIVGKRTYYTAEYPCHSRKRQAWYQVRVTPLAKEWSDTAANMVVVAHVDITSRVLSDIELDKKTQEAEKLALVAKYTDNAVVITNADGQIEWVNEGFSRVSGYELSEVEGEVPGHLLQGPESDPQVVAKMREALKEKRGFDVELVNYRKDGSKYWLAIEVRPIYDEDGNVVKFMALESDITERKRAATEKERLQKELIESSHKAGMAELATDVLHNVGNVLNSINVSAKLIDEQLRNSCVGTLRQAADFVVENSDDLGKFVTEDQRGKLLPAFLDQLATQASGERESVTMELDSLVKNVEHVKEIVAVQQDYAKCNETHETVVLAELVDDAIRAVDASLEALGIQVHRDYDTGIRLSCQKHRILQILVNLISNAKHAVLDAEKSDGEIKVRVFDNDDLATIEVIDNGIGMDASIIDRIYEHGFTTKENGHGFGLHGSANTAIAIGGSLNAASEGIGLGATFRLEVPKNDERAGECQNLQMVAS